MSNTQGFSGAKNREPPTACAAAQTSTPANWRAGRSYQTEMTTGGIPGEHDQSMVSVLHRVRRTSSLRIQIVT